MNAPSGHDHRRTLANLARLLSVMVEIARTAECAQGASQSAPVRKGAEPDRTRPPRRDPASDRASDPAADGNAIDLAAS
jgi:hypothetical protein